MSTGTTPPPEVDENQASDPADRPATWVPAWAPAWVSLLTFRGGAAMGLSGAVVVGLVGWAAVSVFGSAAGHHAHSGSKSRTVAPATPSPSLSIVPVPTPTSSATAPAVASGPLTTAVTCPTATVTVSSADALASALSAARPGTVIDLANGTYGGQFKLTAAGTAAQPVFLCGGRGAVLDGGNSDKGYALHVTDSAYVRLVGFTTQDAQKGVVLDNTQDSVVQGLLVQQTGDEGIHLREHSSDNLVIGNSVTRTGLKRAKYGEGVYIGSAQSNWCTYTDCKPDTSDDNVVKGNVFGYTTAENIDIKEGTTGGRILDNTFNGEGMSPSGATAWVNVKGNGYLIEGNTGTGSLKDGFQTHQILPGWGTDNSFVDNTAVVNGPGFGFHLTPVLGNKVACSNKEQGAAKGLSNIPCS